MAVCSWSRMLLLAATVALLNDVQSQYNELSTVFVSSSAPHGHLLVTIPYWGQSFSITGATTTRPPYEDIGGLFAVFSNGDVVLNGDVSTYHGQRLRVYIKSELKSQSWQDTLDVIVTDAGVTEFADLRYADVKANSRNSMVNLHEDQTRQSAQMLQDDRLKRDATGVHKIVQEVAENVQGNLLDMAQLLGLGTGHGDRFVFKEPSPENLDLNLYTGVIQLKTGFVLDYEKQKQIDFIVVVTRTDGEFDGYEQPVTIRLRNVNDESPYFLNEPFPYLATVSSDAPAHTSVYEMLARDEDEDSLIRYTLESGGDGRFEIDPNTGVVRTVGRARLRIGREYEIGVSATDVRGVNQKTETASVKILVGHRNPQFFEQAYTATVPETAEAQYKIITIQAKAHQRMKITYDLMMETGSESNEFAIGQESGDVDLLRALDYERDPKTYNLLVTAREDCNPPRTSTVRLTITLVDENDNTPTFPLSQYIMSDITEGLLPRNQGIGEVMATDADSVTNALLTYSIDNDNFTVDSLNNIAYLYAKRVLDYDRTPDHTYTFTITATDNGTPPRSAMAQVRVTMKNINDEAPVFAQSVMTVQVSEDAHIGTIVHVVAAFDPDGDMVSYSFAGGSLRQGPFSIEPSSGLIKLVDRLDKSRVSYTLDVVATDDDSCCKKSGQTEKNTRSSNGVVIVEVKDINNNQPRFVDCATYHAEVSENANVDTSVIQVSAVDDDTGKNGNVSYSLIKSTSQHSELFVIDPNTGVLRTAEVFDREAKTGVSDYGVTVKVEDQGSPRLAGFCTFQVKITDTNDHAPVFDFPHYPASIEEGSAIGKRVVQVYATDRDAHNNGEIIYSLKSDPSRFFRIHPTTGWITVAKPMSGRTSVRLVVEARDKGQQSKTVSVNVDVSITQTVNTYPRWEKDYEPIKISESLPVNTVVMRLRAVATGGGPGGRDTQMVYRIMRGGKPEHNGAPRSFYSKLGKNNEMLLLTYRALDFEATPEYVLTIKAANRAHEPLSNTTRVTIRLEDENDEIPQFVGLDENLRYPGSVAENLNPGAEVISVTAQDRDDTDAYKKITYNIKKTDSDSDKFVIDPETGLITTTMKFDREQKKEYYITVVASDGAISNRPNHQPPGTPNKAEAEVQIRITDKNDNAPHFKKLYYRATVPENTETGTVIITVTAEDKDEDNKLTYSITGGNVGNAFEVVPDVGAIRVRGKLDYEEGRKFYELEYRVFDDKYQNTSIVRIDVTDVNDNPPRFEHAIYNVTDLVEEEQGLSTRPKYLLTVHATDPDTHRNSIIEYSLTGQFSDDGTFSINGKTGEIYLHRSLDRDKPHGRPVWNFNVLAHDEVRSDQPSLVGYAEVRVSPQDINDNAPVFDPKHLIGRVPENSDKDRVVLTVIAKDADAGANGSVYYSIKQNAAYASQQLFKIHSEHGMITTTSSNVLDRERQDRYSIIVQANDRGRPGRSSSATVTIHVADVNDHAPKFTQSLYRATMSESFPKGTSIVSISATDADLGENARLTYTLREIDREYFSMMTVSATNTGVLKVYKPVDYDVHPRPSFNLTVHVQDPNLDHIDTAYIELAVTDYNDNAPVFQPNSHKVTQFENVTIGTVLGTLRAHDADTGINKQFSYSIDRSTDPHHQFTVHNNGIVVTAKALDRETLPVHRVHVLATDKGEPAQTGTGTLIVTLRDVNDNFPIFAEDYRPVLYENAPPFTSVVTVSATDRDTATNGPPFTFWLPCGSEKCPCTANPTCNLFSFKFIQGGGREGHGSGVVTSLVTFDREKQKEYYMPIIMKDSGRPSISGTNTLTIIIGDVNDNKHFPGHKTVTVYNYKGQFKDAILGNVYAEDEDDWDVNDKTFTFVDPSTADRFKLSSTGMLSMNGKLAAGSYTFEVTVFDKLWKRSVVSTVTINVQDITDEAILKSGSLRIEGVTADQFVERPKVGGNPNDYGKSQYDLMGELIAGQLGVVVANVDIFTVRDHPTLKNTVDIRYSAHGSPYYEPSRLDGILIQNKDEFERSLGVNLLMTPVDECLKETCESGGCTNNLVTTSEPLVVNTNGSTLVGVTSYIEAECTCGSRKFTGGSEVELCAIDSCLHGGICEQRQYDFICKCPPEFDGPRCEQTRHSFHGNGWAWYEPLSQCEQSHTRLEFVTTKPNGLILYNGPLSMTEGVRDYIALELRAGYPILHVDHGSGSVKLGLESRNELGSSELVMLNDGKWHRVDIFRNGKEVRMMIDQCKSAKIVENENRGSSQVDRSSCEVIGETPGENKYINVNAPLQLGGRSGSDLSFPAGLMQDGFDGCIKNLIHNAKLYDLHIGRVGQQKNSQDGCSREDAVCGANDIGGARCGKNGVCIGSFLSGHLQCICLPGWRGDKCHIETTTKDFGERSYIEWDFKEAFYHGLESRLHHLQLQLMFRTRQNAGLLLKAQNAQKSEYILMEIVGGRLQFRYNLGSGENEVSLQHVNISDGEWHTAHVDRVADWASLSLDGGDGRRFNQTLPGQGHAHIRVSQRGMFAGGDVRFPSVGSEPLVDWDYIDSCMNDVRYNGEWLPMDTTENGESIAAEVVRHENIGAGCRSAACLSLTCVAPLMCIDLWRYAECRCAPGQRMVGAPEICVNINECADSPCLSGGTCIDRDDGYVCNCPPGYTGLRCGVRQEAVVAFISTGAILAIIICAIILLLVILLFVIYSRQRRRPDSYVVGMDPDDDVRENIINYDEEGVGEEDQDAYDINRLKKPLQNGTPRKTPVDEKTIPKTQERPQYRAPPGGEMPPIGDFIGDRLRGADDDPSAPPHDSVREYAYEGAGSDAGSLSSLASSDSDRDADYDFLNKCGPQFARLADMYGAGDK